ncbi:hypothetical protein K435DRAFT_783872 [Dendrothele bispora CBS 962.96]|uniref:Uncharacterized protein n=1 Tax=Dendrothele bispora (strain CBS 962.96) TaxID=1314807 RepID=A0A4S8L6H9_DENBC|nr:hypothetical protein K435DRAFT_783872 [Dendrothele bispora CBS 962.96]
MMLSDPKTLAQVHLPAVKVGGRRLSISKHKPHTGTTEPVPETTTVELSSDQEQPTDYPRPVAGTEQQQQHAPHHNHNEEEIPAKKDKKSHFDLFAHKKTEETKPTREFQAGNKGFGAGGRIAQPAGKVLGA